jgi:HK97 family phage major capsid protein
MTYSTPSGTRSKVSSAARAAMLLMATKGDLLQAEDAALRAFPHDAAVQAYFKAAVSAGGTSDIHWAASLAAHAEVVGGLVAAQRAASVLGKLRGVRRVPFNTRTVAATTGSEGSFVLEGTPAPVAEMDLATTQLAHAKYQCVLVFTRELTRTWTPAAEDSIGADLVAGAAAGIDKAFLGDPSAVAEPASILHGITPLPSTGGTVAAITNDLKALLAQQIAFGNDLSNSVFVMSAKTALHISTLRDPSGLAFPTMNVAGTGTLFGLPALVSGGVALAGSPSDGGYIALLNPARILLADDGEALLDVSQHGAVQMQSAPSTGGQALLSLWQHGFSAVRVTRFINWARASDDAVSLLGDVQY